MTVSKMLMKMSMNASWAAECFSARTKARKAPSIPENQSLLVLTSVAAAAAAAVGLTWLCSRIAADAAALGVWKVQRRRRRFLLLQPTLNLDSRSASFRRENEGEEQKDSAPFPVMEERQLFST